MLLYKSVKILLYDAGQGRDPEHKMLSKWSELEKAKSKRTMWSTGL